VATITFILSILLFSSVAVAQNLVNNGSFESYAECPTADGQLHYAAGWYNPTNASPDLFHACSNSNGGRVGVPKHPGGFQYARTGEGYAAVILFGWTPGDKKRSYREYMGTKLRQPLEKGKTYCISMYVALYKQSRYAVRGPGVYFSNDSLFQLDLEPLRDVSPQLDNQGNGFLNDTMNWTKLSWSYTPADNYSWMMIGNFRDNEATAIETIRDIPEEQSTLAYYYIDDISVTQMPEDTGLITDQFLPCGAPITVSVGTFDEYKWSSGTTAAFDTIRQPGKYWVWAANGCSAFTDTFNVFTVDTTTMPFSIDDKVISCNNPVNIQLPSFESYLWSNGEVGPSITIHNAGSYWAVVSNNCGVYADTFKVTNEGCLFVPTAFSPNGDGRNEIFRPKGIINPNGYSLNIYNRWGQLVFITTDITKGWNGMHNASHADVGVYNWHIRYRNENGKELFLKGNVTVIR